VVEVTQARELATALISVERFDADGNFHPDYLAMLDKYRQAGVQQGLDMAAGVAKVGWVSADYNIVGIADADVAMRLCEHIEAAIRKLGGGDA